MVSEIIAVKIGETLKLGNTGDMIGYENWHQTNINLGVKTKA